MALTADELRERQRYLGGSDVPALLGISRYKTAVDLWLEKTGRVEPTPTTSRPADLGDRLEPALVDLAADAVGETPERNVRATDDFLSSQADGLLPNAGILIEAKTRGLFNPRFDANEWGPEGTDQVPYDVLAQVVFGMHLHGVDRAIVSALLGQGIGHRLYEVRKSQALADEIVALATRFWTDHVQADVRPEGMPSLDVVQQVARDPVKTTVVPEELGHRWAGIKEQEAAVKAALDHTRVEVLDAMGDATFGDTGWGVFSFKADAKGRRRFLYKEHR